MSAFFLEDMPQTLSLSLDRLELSDCGMQVLPTTLPDPLRSHPSLLEGLSLSSTLWYSSTETGLQLDGTAEVSYLFHPYLHVNATVSPSSIVTLSIPELSDQDSSLSADHFGLEYNQSPLAHDTGTTLPADLSLPFLAQITKQVPTNHQPADFSFSKLLEQVDVTRIDETHYALHLPKQKRETSGISLFPSILTITLSKKHEVSALSATFVLPEIVHSKSFSSISSKTCDLTLTVCPDHTFLLRLTPENSKSALALTLKPSKTEQSLRLQMTSVTLLTPHGSASCSGSLELPLTCSPSMSP